MEAWFFLAALVSEVVGTIAGFGSSTVFLPIAVLFFDFRTALVLVATLHVFGNLSRVGFFRKGLDLGFLVKFGLPGVIFSFIGASLVSFIPQDLLKVGLGVFLVLYSLGVLLKDSVRIRPNVFNVVVGGAVSGFVAGVIGTAGALRGAFLTGFRLGKEKYVATAAATAILVDLTRIPVYLSQGFIKPDFYWYIPVFLVVALVGSYLGRRIVTRLPQKLFVKIVLVAILTIGIKFILDWFVVS